MSSYHDDTQETGVISNTIISGMQILTEEIVHVANSVIFGMFMLVSESATASDAVITQRLNLITETAAVSSTALGSVLGSDLVVDTVPIADTVHEKLIVLHTASGVISNAVIEHAQVITAETALASSTVIATRTVETLVVDTAKAADTTFRAGSYLTAETGVIADTVISGKHTASTIAETATVSDSAITSRSSASLPVTEQGALSSSVINHVHAYQTITETAVVQDLPVVKGSGAAWTANVASWAMTRYAPYTFTQLVTIDGKGYGVTPDGVYALIGGAETLNGSLVFGKLDLSGDELVHPVGSLLEYAMSNGNAYMDVTESQSGADLQYTYTLAAKTADKLTNNRFVFGRGLRGRHFQFTLRIAAKSAEINDLRIDMTQTKRRV